MNNFCKYQLEENRIRKGLKGQRVKKKFSSDIDARNIKFGQNVYFHSEQTNSS
jgi:hypothetical protein